MASMAMAALPCLTPLAGRRSGACISLFRATLHSSSLVRFSVGTSLERGLRSQKVRGEEKGFNLRTERPRSITVNAANQGAIDSPLMNTMATKIKDSLQAEDVSIVDAYGDGRHVSIDVTAEAFEGKSRVNRQRMVYKAIWEELQSAVHAVDQLRTRTPAEAANAGKSL